LTSWRFWSVEGGVGHCQNGGFELGPREALRAYAKPYHPKPRRVEVEVFTVGIYEKIEIWTRNEYGDWRSPCERGPVGSRIHEEG